MSYRVSKFFILNGEHFPTGRIVGDDHIAVASGLSHCLEKLEEDPAPAPVAAPEPEVEKPLQNLVTAKKIRPSKA